MKNWVAFTVACVLLASPLATKASESTFALVCEYYHWNSRLEAMSGSILDAVGSGAISYEQGMRKIDALHRTIAQQVSYLLDVEEAKVTNVRTNAVGALERSRAKYELRFAQTAEGQEIVQIDRYSGGAQAWIIEANAGETKDRRSGSCDRRNEPKF